MAASNVSFGILDHKYVNAAFIVLAIQAGWVDLSDNPLVTEINTAVLAADLSFGKDEFAWMLASMDELEREQQHAEGRQRQNERAEIKQVDDELDYVGDMVRTLTRAVLLANGYHPHKGQWRKKQDGIEHQG